MAGARMNKEWLDRLSAYVQPPREKQTHDDTDRPASPLPQRERRNRTSALRAASWLTAFALFLNVR